MALTDKLNTDDAWQVIKHSLYFTAHPTRAVNDGTGHADDWEICLPEQAEMYSVYGHVRLLNGQTEDRWMIDYDNMREASHAALAMGFFGTVWPQGEEG